MSGVPTPGAGRYSTLNEYLARNPAMPREVVVAMYRGGEANKSAFEMNPALPGEPMRKIAATGNELDCTWLSANRSLPPDIMKLLESDASETGPRFLKQNPTYRRTPGVGASAARGWPEPR